MSDSDRHSHVEDFRIFVRADNTDIKGPRDLKGKRVAVTTGSTNKSWSRRISRIPTSVPTTTAVGWSSSTSAA
ncbi:MAG: transporter substrate-binding domain-containing protein [Paraburkholderia sp.]